MKQAIGVLLVAVVTACASDPPQRYKTDLEVCYELDALNLEFGMPRQDIYECVNWAQRERALILQQQAVYNANKPRTCYYNDFLNSATCY
jgi:hypothetical protein